MRKIGNILTDGKFDSEGIYNVVSSKDDLISGIPTLVIGWDFVKKNYPEANIINWKIDNNTYWTFGNRERRAQYEVRLEDFKNLSIERLIKNVKYVPFSVLTETDENKKEFFGMINNESLEKLIYTRNDMLYLYLPSKEVVYGVSLRDIWYIGKNAEKFVQKIYKTENVDSVNSIVGQTLTHGMISKFKNCMYIIPCLCYDND